MVYFHYVNGISSRLKLVHFVVPLSKVTLCKQTATLLHSSKINQFPFSLEMENVELCAPPGIPAWKLSRACTAQAELSCLHFDLGQDNHLFQDTRQIA